MRSRLLDCSEQVLSLVFLAWVFLVPSSGLAQLADDGAMQAEPDLASVFRATVAHHPSVERARLYVESRSAYRRSADGYFDLRVGASGYLVPVGYYDHLRFSVQADQPLRVAGASLSVGYRRGTGDIADYYGEYRTLSGGELFAGLKLPLLQNRRIDNARAAVQQADYALAAAEIYVAVETQKQLKEGALAWLKWQAARQKLAVAESMLRIAEERSVFLERRVDAGLSARIELVDNDRALADRRSKVLSARQEVRRAAIALSLFSRDSNGLPSLPTSGPSLAPPTLPEWEAPSIEAARGLSAGLRPELFLVANQREQLALRSELVRNGLLPSLTAGVGVSQDLGNRPPEYQDSLAPFTASVGLSFEMPVQRRAARGEAEVVALELERLGAEQQLARETIETEILAALAGWELWVESWEQARLSLDAAQTLVDAERTRFEAGSSSVFQLNLRESQLAAANEQVINAAYESWYAMISFEAAVGRIDAPEQWLP
jgi:outer membrane protein TolC